MRSKALSVAATFILAAVLAGCGAGTDPAGQPSYRGGSGQPLSDIKLTAAQISALGHDDDLFAGSLVKAMAGTSNLVVSPASIAIALQMLTDGAAGTTQHQLEQVLRTGSLDDRQLTAASASLFKQLASISGLSVSDDLWLQQGLKPEASYASDLSSGFNGGLHQLDFDNGSAAAKTINDAISADTDGHITNLVDSSIEGDVAMLTNAVYLHADWLHPFDVGQTEPAAFTGADGTSSQVPTMNQTASFAYADKGSYQVATLPYVGGRLSMSILLPKLGTTPAAIEALAATSGWSALVSGTSPTSLMLALPKFALKTSVDLSTVLQSMGITDAFGQSAQLPGICESIGSCQVSDVQHQAWIQTGEKGTTAAAATSVGITATATRADPVAAVTMNVDRPFIALIRDSTTGLPLFVAQVDDPTVGS